VRICIPTYQRTQVLQDNTLAYLERSEIDPANVLILVADYAEMSAYREALAEQWASQLRLTAPGLIQSRAFARHFLLDDGEEVMWLDDDVKSMRRMLNSKEHEEAPLMEIAEAGFDATRELFLKLWGVYPTVNPFFMGPRVRAGLWYCVGAAYGEINTHDDRLDPMFGDAKEDVERCLRHHETVGGVVRLDWFAVQTGYFRTQGGIQNRTNASMLKNIQQLEARWPGRLRRNTKKDYPDVLMVDDWKLKSTEAMEVWS
jgi:hypothetical protein